jgi:GSG1-like protein
MAERIDSLNASVLRRTAALGVISATIALLSAASALSAPMRCSGEEKVCIAACKKSLDRSSLPICLTNCGQRQSACMKSGCWDSGPQRYCGLLKQ